MSKDIVSIILPVYNSEEFIFDTIESVLNQTYQKFELIIINDGSNDSTDEICSEYQKKYQQIKYFSTANQGVSNARNIGLKHAIGKYVVFIDSDDTYQRNYLEELLRYIEKNNADLACCAYQTLSPNPKKINYQTNLVNCNFQKFIETLQPCLLINQIWNKLYKLDIINNNNLLFNTKIDLAEDYQFNLKYMSLCKKLVYLNLPLYNYRIKEDGLRFKYRKNNSKIKLKLLNELEKLYIEKEYNLNYVNKNYLIQYFAYFSNIVDIRNLSAKKEKLKEIKKIISQKKYRQKIKNIRKQMTIKYKLICNILLIKNKYFIYNIGLLANYYDKKMKQHKYL